MRSPVSQRQNIWFSKVTEEKIKQILYKNMETPFWQN